uniref:Phosphoinositide phospholipase C n=1 Tax=Anabas testudineus TaxID=64144 RepID=A0A3Q1JHI2_ANATE
MHTRTHTDSVSHMNTCVEYTFLPVTLEKCMSSMQMGTQMVKLRGGSKGLVRFFYLDEHKSCIRWRPSRKNEKAKISIDSIREVCEGKQSEIFQRYAEGSFDPNCCFSLYYGEHMESLDLVSGTGEEARTWITGLKYLMAGISDEDSLAKRQRTRDQYPSFTLLQLYSRDLTTFTEADKNGDGSLSISEVLQLLHKLNVNLPRQKVKQMFKEADTDDNQGTLGFEEFCSFYKMMSTRRDLYLLMLTYSNHKDHLDTNDLARFLETEQKMTKVTKDHCLEIINKFEPCSENQKQGVLGIDGFTNYMRSPAGDIFNPEHYNVNQDMNQPLCNYFIASSHNTYLMGDQLMSQSRVDMYAWVLQAGCRCVEVDCWDGQDGEPIVHHGYTLTSKILFKDVIETINKYAFIKNDFPVILSIENHCSVPQQKKMAQYLIEILGDKLDLSNIKADESGRLPSPETLKGKILVKGKKLPANIDENAEEGDVSDEDSADEMEDDCKLMNGDQVENMAKKKLDNLMKESKIRDREDPDSFTIAALPPAGKTTDKSDAFVLYLAANCSWQVSSLSETKAHQVMQQKASSFIHFNQRQLSRIYPSSYRVDSSNFNPQPFWNSGCQLVALNYQSEGRVLQLNRAKFYSNGNCGYVHKPACMCEGAFNPNLEDPLPGQMKKQLVVKIISGQQLPKPKDSMMGDRGEIIDPFVEVEIIGLPVDCNKEQTRVVDDNGFNPMWEETLVFTVHMPELALVRFLVWDHDPIGQDFIGQRTIAFNSMMPGYRHVYLEGMEEASIFVHVAVNDITGKAKAASGIKGLFHRNPKQASLDSHAAAQHSRKHPFGAHLLRRTASAPTKGQPKNKKGFPEIAIDTKDYSSEGASEERESEDRDKASAATSHQSTPPQHRNGDSLGPWDRPDTNGAFHPEEGKDCSTAQRPSSPLQSLALNSEDAKNTRFVQSVSTQEESLSSHHSSSTPLGSSSTAINADSQVAVPSNGLVDSPIKVSGDLKKPSTPSRTITLPTEKTVPSCFSQDTHANRSTHSFLENTPREREHRDTRSENNNNTEELMSDHRAEPPAAAVSTGTPVVSGAQTVSARRALFSNLASHAPVRRAKTSEDSPGRLTQRRHTWNRLYMEGLKQSSANRPSSGPSSPAAATTAAISSISKSLGDLTSDDISCNFDSKYRSISRSFIIRPTRDQLRRGSPQKSQPVSNLTEQLRKLTDVEPLTASDFAPENRPRDSQEEPVDEMLVRRTSSRSQSRVRYIANRAKKAQERQRLQGLIQGRSASFSLTGSVGSGSSASPIEERGNPEGACCVAQSPCTSLDLLSQLSPIGSPSPRQSQTSPDPENSEVFFMLKL